MRPLLFFDGECGLCSASVEFILRHERTALIQFSPLQGESAKRIVPKEKRELLNSLVLADDHGLWDQSEALLRIAAYMGWPWRLATLFRIVPKAWRDFLYRQVARHRYAWFPKNQSCRFGNSGDKERFIP